jgi:hypothetical protein
MILFRYQDFLTLFQYVQLLNTHGVPVLCSIAFQYKLSNIIFIRACVCAYAFAGFDYSNDTHQVPSAQSNIIPAKNVRRQPSPRLYSDDTCQQPP